MTAYQHNHKQLPNGKRHATLWYYHEMSVGEREICFKVEYIFEPYERSPEGQITAVMDSATGYHTTSDPHTIERRLEIVGKDLVATGDILPRASHKRLTVADDAANWIISRSVENIGAPDDEWEPSHSQAF